MIKVENEKELGEAIKRGEESIEIEADLKNKVVKIKAKGKTAWGICIGGITIAVVAILAIPATAGTSTGASAFIATPALAGTVAVLGVPTTITAIGIAVGGGSAAILNQLRKYRVEELPNGKAILHRK